MQPPVCGARHTFSISLSRCVVKVPCLQIWSYWLFVVFRRGPSSIIIWSIPTENTWMKSDTGRSYLVILNGNPCYFTRSDCYLVRLPWHCLQTFCWVLPQRGTTALKVRQLVQKERPQLLQPSCRNITQTLHRLLSLGRFDVSKLAIWFVLASKVLPPS